MKKVKNVALLLSIQAVVALSSCGGNTPSSPEEKPVSQETSAVSIEESVNSVYNSTVSEELISELLSIGSSETIDSSVSEETSVSVDDTQAKIAEAINIAIAKLDELINPVISKISNNDLRTSVQNYYNTEKASIQSIKDLDSAKNAVNKVIEDTGVFANEVLKPLAIEKINEVVNPLINAITYNDLKVSVQTFYDSEMLKIASVDTLEEIPTTFDEIVNDTKEFIKSETDKTIIALKNKAIEELNPYATALISKIPFDTLKVDTQSFYDDEIKKLKAVDSIDGISPCVEEIKEDLESFAVTEAKKIAVKKLEDIVDDGLERIPNPTLKSDLTDFSEVEIAKLNSVEKIEQVLPTLTSVTDETTAHIKDLLKSTVKEYLSRLTAIESATAYDYLPSAMKPGYANNVVNASDIAYNFANSTNVSAIHKSGFGEQWQMVVENVDQSILMAKVFNVAQTALNAAGNAVDIYITNSYADEMSYSFSGAGFTGLFEFKNAKLVFNIELTNSIEIPLLGSFKPLIKMEYDLINEAKGMFISLGDAYKVKYVIRNDAYEMATTYGITIAGKNASRSSYLSISNSNNKTTGHIYEYTTLEGSDKIQACADFYVQDEFVSVVGNKSSGLIGFDGYINELYLANEGRLLGYEVRESLTIAGITGTYNTLWFNLWDIDGVNSVKVCDKTDANKSSLSTVDVYLNGSSTLLSSTYNTKIIKTSRKYDVEFRNRYYYTYDSENEKYVANEVKVPMFFIQEGDNFNSFEADILKDNNISASVKLSASYLNKILSDYDTLIDVFIANKDSMSSDAIISYLAQYE